MTTIGILMLDTRFPRVPGDIGHPGTWPFPVLYRVVPRASARAAVCQGAAGLLEPMVAAARALVAEGADALTTSCGFLAPFQADLAAAAGVPVAASALMQVPMIDRLLPSGRRCGVVTIDSGSLGAAHLAAAGAPPDTPVRGTESGRALTRVVLGDEATLDVAAAEADVVDAARTLVTDHPEVGAILLECTNMAPYAAAVRTATGRPVYSIVTLVSWLHAGVDPPGFEGR